MRRIAVLTSGGDAPGMNAVVASVARFGETAGWEAMAVRSGFAGLASGHVTELERAAAEKHEAAPGTWLGTSRWPALTTKSGQKLCLDAATALGLDALVVIGGNGSARGARALTRNVPIAFVPATIDHDIVQGEMAIGGDSAVAYAMTVIDQLRVTASALPGRAFLVQTLGAPTGLLAEAVARAAGVPDPLVPDGQATLDAIAARLKLEAASGPAIAVMSEAAGDAVRTSEALAERAGVRVHPTILGHAQRAAAPSALDLRAARRAGEAAISEAIHGRSSFIALTRAGEPVPTDLAGEASSGRPVQAGDSTTTPTGRP